VARSYADVARSYLARHILPRFGSERLDGITSHSIDAWATGLKDQLSPATANRCLAILRVLLREAERQGLIATNPAAGVQQLRETPRERGILTLEEARRLLDENRFADYWRNEITYTANLLSATTGMRLGEILALRTQDIRNGYAAVEHSWDRTHGMKSTKTRQVREIPITIKTSRWLARLAANYAASYVFSTNGGRSPIYYKVVIPEQWFGHRQRLDQYLLTYLGLLG
jgi:integrase